MKVLSSIRFQDLTFVGLIACVLIAPQGVEAQVNLTLGGGIGYSKISLTSRDVPRRPDLIATDYPYKAAGVSGSAILTFDPWPQRTIGLAVATRLQLVTDAIKVAPDDQLNRAAVTTTYVGIDPSLRLQRGMFVGKLGFFVEYKIGSWNKVAPEGFAEFPPFDAARYESVAFNLGPTASLGLRRERFTVDLVTHLRTRDAYAQPLELSYSDGETYIAGGHLASIQLSMGVSLARRSDETDGVE